MQNIFDSHAHYDDPRFDGDRDALLCSMAKHGVRAIMNVGNTTGANLAGIELARRLRGMAPVDFPQETAIGALGLYVSNESIGNFQPMNVNFGIIPPLDHRVKGKRNKNAELSARSLAIIEARKEDILQ